MRMPVHPSGRRRTSSQFAFTVVGIFFYFAMTMALYAGITLLHPGTVLDGLWSLNSGAHRELLPFRKPAGMFFVLLAAVAATTGIGWFRHRVWAWRLAVLGICAQVFGDCANLIRGDLLRGGAGLLIGGALLLYLLSSNIRQNFNPAGEVGAPADQKAAH